MCRVLAASVAVSCSLAGCKPDTATHKAEVLDEGTKDVNARPAATSLDPTTLGTVVGTVHFEGKAPVPVLIDKSMDPACTFGGGDTYSERPAKGDTYSEQYVVHDGKLANVYVYVKSGPQPAMLIGTAGAAPVVLNQEGCVYTPHVIAVVMGGSVEFRNEDSTMHNVHAMPAVAGNEAVDISQGPHGTPQVKRFKQAELMIPVRCNNHPWMNAFINVSATPWFGVTGPDGQFEMRGLPAGEYTLAAVHEKLGEQEFKVTVKPRQIAVATFTYTMK
jgi:plastocyanin